MTFNSSGVRDIARVLKIAINTVLNTLKKLKPIKTDALKYYKNNEEILFCEVDEPGLMLKTRKIKDGSGMLGTQLIKGL